MFYDQDPRAALLRGHDASVVHYPATPLARRHEGPDVHVHGVWLVGLQRRQRLLHRQHRQPSRDVEVGPQREGVRHRFVGDDGAEASVGDERIEHGRVGKR